MEHVELKRRKGFHVVAGSDRSQAATMVLDPSTSTGGPDNTHAADQWLYVMSGRGRAVVEGCEVEMDSGDLLLIEQGESHEIINNGEEPLVTLNLYAPPAY